MELTREQIIERHNEAIRRYKEMPEEEFNSLTPEQRENIDAYISEQEAALATLLSEIKETH